MILFNQNKILKVVLLLMLLAPLSTRFLLYGDDDVSKRYRRAAKKYNFSIQATATFPRHIKGMPLPIDQVESELNRFFEALDELGEKFVRQSGLRKVMICHSLQLYGMNCGGIAYKDCIYLCYGFSKRTVYHEMFHVFDNEQDSKKWQRLNDREFRYRGIDFPDRPQRKSDKRDLEEHYRDVRRNFDADFASDYAQSNEKEDRAETFAHMVAEGKAFVERARRSPVLYNKMLYIIELTGRKSLLGKNYWSRKLGSNISGKPEAAPRRRK